MVSKSTGIKVLTVVLAVLLTIALALTLRAEQKRQQLITQQFAEFEAKARPYQTERDALANELTAMKKALTYKPEKTTFMVGFLPVLASDLPYIREKAEKYHFAPLVVLDCSRGLEELQPIIQDIDPTWEIMLYAPRLSQTEFEDVLTVRAYLTSIGREDTGLFLLRDDFATKENLQLLQQNGFIGYTTYQTPPTCGQDANDMVFTDYAYARGQNEGFLSRVTEILSAKAATVFSIELEALHSGALSEEQLLYYMDTMQKNVSDGKAVFSTVSEVVKELSTVNAMLAQRKAEYEAKAAVSNQRIEELDAIIKELYEQYGPAL